MTTLSKNTVIIIGLLKKMYFRLSLAINVKSSHNLIKLSTGFSDLTTTPQF